jgi:hypothetical protein
MKLNPIESYIKMTSKKSCVDRYINYFDPMLRSTEKAPKNDHFLDHFFWYFFQSFPVFDRSVRFKSNFDSYRVTLLPSIKT